MLFKSCETLKDFLFNESVDRAERKARLKMVWEVADGMEAVRDNMAAKTMATVMSMLKASLEFRGYRVEPDGFDEGSLAEPIVVTREAWCPGGDRPIVSYTLEPYGGGLRFFWVGIRKADEGTPFLGDWKTQSCRLPARIHSALCHLYEAFGEAWNNAGEKWAVSSYRETGPEWIVRQHIFPRTYRMENVQFYLELIERGHEGVAREYVRMFTLMKHATEKYLDKLARFYRKD